MFKIPILLLIFNRPKNVKRIIKILEEIKPSKIYISADGPRNNKTGDLKLCHQTRKLSSKLSWNCSVKKNFFKYNLGVEMLFLKELLGFLRMKNMVLFWKMIAFPI